MHYCISILLCILCLSRVSAVAQTESSQQTFADSLRRVIATAKHDTTRVNAMIEMSWYCWDVSRFDSALVYAQQAKKTAERCGYRKGLADARSNIANVAWFQGRYAEALEQYAQSLRIREELGNKPAIASTLNNIANVYSRQGKNTEALEYYTKSLTVHEELGNKVQIANLLLNIGVVYYQQDKYSQALENYTKALRIYEQRNDKEDISLSFNNIGNVYAKQGRYSEALDAYFKALRLREALGNKAPIAVSLENIGNLYFRQGRYNEALKQYAKALHIYETLGNKSSTAYSLSLIGRAYSAQGEYSAALENYAKALRLREELGNKASIASVLSDIGNTYRLQGRYSEALDYQRKAFRTQEALGNMSGMGVTLNEMGQVYRLVGKFDEALASSRHALHLADSLGVRPQKRDALEALAICYDSLGQHKRALEYHRQFVALKDSIVNAESLEKTAKLREGYEAEKREQQIALLNKEKTLQESELARAATEQKAQMQSIVLLRNEKHVQELTVQQQEAALTEAHLREERNREALKLSATQSELQRAELAQRTAELARRNAIQWSLAAILAAVVAGAFWLGVLYRQKNAANKAILQQQALLEDQAVEIHQANMELYQQNEELTALNAEKNEIMGIVSHDLKNPIGAVRSYAELIENQTFTGDEVLSASSQIVQVSERMLDLVKNLLDMNQLESGGLQFTMVRFDISPVVEAAVYQYQVPAEAKQITLHYSQESAENIASADEQALMQVLDNLVSNAVKYSPHGKQVFVRLVNTDRAVRIEIQDEGPGISPDDMKKLFGKFARLSAQPTGGEHSTGLGLSIVKKMVEAMNGKVWCESEVGKGATFIVELPSVSV